MIANMTTAQNATSVLSSLDNLHLNYNHTNPEEQFRQAAFGYGIILPDTIIDDGRLHRFKIDGKMNGAYTFHNNECPAGFFQDHKQGIKETWRATAERKEFSDTDKQAYKRRCIEKEQQRHKKDLSLQATAATKAAYIWSHAVSGDHPYLLKKTIKELSLIHISEPTRLGMISYAVFCLKKKKKK